MFHPVGSQPPSVYWRRRLALLASILALLALIGITVHVLTSKDSASSATGVKTSSAPSPTRTHSSSTAPSSTRQSSTAATGTTSSSPSSSTSMSSSSSSPANTAVAKCNVAALGLAAASDKKKYPANAQPLLSILVTNKGKVPCVQDLADPQIVLRVYNGESRVWGSHDCKINPGKNNQTLMAGRTVRVTVEWSGLSSEKNCTGTRQRVGAGTYTLHAALSGRDGKTSQFTIA